MVAPSAGPITESPGVDEAGILVSDQSTVASDLHEGVEFEVQSVNALFLDGSGLQVNQDDFQAPVVIQEQETKNRTVPGAQNGHRRLDEVPWGEDPAPLRMKSRG